MLTEMSKEHVDAKEETRFYYSGLLPQYILSMSHFIKWIKINNAIKIENLRQRDIMERAKMQ
jgi:hypothetical protein